MVALSLVARIYYRHDIKTIPLEDIRRAITRQSISVSTGDTLVNGDTGHHISYDPQPMTSPCAALESGSVNVAASINDDVEDDSDPIIWSTSHSNA